MARNNSSAKSNNRRDGALARDNSSAKSNSGPASVLTASLVPGPTPIHANSDADFAHLAEYLFNRVELVVAGQVHRLCEVEFYWHSPGHPDPFVHVHPLQLTSQRWYFHRAGNNHRTGQHGSYRGGSFKGVDLTFGDGHNYGGVLIRAVERTGTASTPGVLIDGPSRTVDQLLKTTGYASIAALDRAIAGRSADDPASPLHLRLVERVPSRRVVWSVRVGLTLRSKLGDLPTQVRFLLAPYRALCEPARLTKGRVQLAIARYACGHDASAIARLLHTRRAVVERWLLAIQTQAANPPADFTAWLDQPLTSEQLCCLAGAWQAYSRT